MNIFYSCRDYYNYLTQDSYSLEDTPASSNKNTEVLKKDLMSSAVDVSNSMKSLFASKTIAPPYSITEATDVEPLLPEQDLKKDLMKATARACRQLNDWLKFPDIE